MGLFSNKYRVIFVDKNSTPLVDIGFSLKKQPLPSIGECIVLNGKSYRVYNVIHSIDDKLTWIACDPFIDESDGDK